MQNSSRPYLAASARINRVSSPSSGVAPSSGKDDKQAQAITRASEVIARYNEVNVLFSSQFPGLDISDASRPSQANFSAPPASIISNSSHHAYGFHGDDGYDVDCELAFEINASMDLVHYMPNRHRLEALPVAPTYPWSASSCVPGGAPTTPMYTGPGDERENGTSTQELPPAQSYPCTPPTAGELMITALPSDAMLSTQSLRMSSGTGQVVKDLERLGESLQRNARIQLQELIEGESNKPRVS